jgi:hypothetical protein
MASSRIVPPPALRSTELDRAEKMIPPAAAMAPEITKTVIRIRATLMPLDAAGDIVTNT